MALYVLMFEPQFKHAKYYFGYCKDGGFKRRFAQHITGHGAKIVQRAIEAGIEIIPVLVCEGTAQDEARLKRWNNNERVLNYLKKRGRNGN